MLSITSTRAPLARAVAAAAAPVESFCTSTSSLSNGAGGVTPGIKAPTAESTSGATVAGVETVAIHVLAPSPTVTIVRGCSRVSSASVPGSRSPTGPLGPGVTVGVAAVGASSSGTPRAAAALPARSSSASASSATSTTAGALWKMALLVAAANAAALAPSTTVVPPSGNAVRDWNSLTDGVGSTVGSGLGVHPVTSKYTE